MSEFTPFPTGPNVGTQLKALRRKQQVSNKKAVLNEASFNSSPEGAVPLAALTLAHVTAWFEQQNWKPFSYQLEAWQAIQTGRSGLLHASTGAGKTLAVWLGALLRLSTLSKPRGAATRVMWVTPMRALAADSALAGC